MSDSPTPIEEKMVVFAHFSDCPGSPVVFAETDWIRFKEQVDNGEIELYGEIISVEYVPMKNWGNRYQGLPNNDCVTKEALMSRILRFLGLSTKY